MDKKKQQFKVIIEQGEDGFFVASVPSLPGCYTQAKTVKELKKRVFKKIRKKGSNKFFKPPDGRFTLVPHHSNEDIGKGLLRQILREIKVSPEEFTDVL